MKTCLLCRTEKPATDFHNVKRNKDGLHSYCKPCRKRYDAGKYAGDSHKKRQQKDMCAERRTRLTQYKTSKGCLYCPETDGCCLDFHHRDPNQKDFDLAAKLNSRSWQTVLKEIEKCDVVCANCHRKLHAERVLCPLSVTEARGPAKAEE